MPAIAFGFIAPRTCVFQPFSAVSSAAPGLAGGQAFALMHEIWQPDPTWSEFIASQLANAHGALSGEPRRLL